MPCFDYCCTVWGKGVTSKSHLNKILKLQKRAARIILRNPLLTNSTEMFEQLKWLTFENRCIYHMGLLIFKCQKQLFPDYISELIIFSNNEN